jgi:hypothetical protein
MSKLISQKHGKIYAGQTNQLPVVGKIEFDENGAIEVPDEFVAELIAATAESFDFRVEGEPKKEKDDEDGDNGSESKLTEEQIADWKELISKASSAELLQMAAEVNLGKPAKVAAMTDEKLRVEILKKVINAK